LAEEEKESPSGAPEGPGDAVDEATGLDIDALRKALEEEREKADRYLANWQRAQADYINFRRRVEQERSESAKLLNALLIISFLPILDDLERALDSVSASLAGLNWVQGIRLIYQKMRSTLEAQGLREIQADGEDFDPNFHEAVMQADGEEGKVVQVLQKGYCLQDRVIRPAMVAF